MPLDDASFPADEAAALLLAARRENRLLPTLPGPLRPRSAAQAYAVQDAVLRGLGPVGGWKAGPPKPDGQIFASAVPQALVLRDPGALPALAAAPEAEVELGLVLGRDLGPEAARDPAALRAAIAAVHVAVELLASRFADRRALDSLLPLADAQSNAAILLGPALGSAGLLDVARIEAALRIDGRPAGQDRGAPAGATILESLAWLAGHAAARGVPLRAGQVIVTGARVGPVPLPPGVSVEATLRPGGHPGGTLSFRLPAAGQARAG
ncbi:fumarylacetoacetate hydrolase family protein [Roseomonas sp. OT10]|uniref:fumarylacetoacetate hydrolase family protein n=1 Tax=Roseomonas cutis TaxID=2897332 RepID=UPI001E60864C|nr:fumarylacetoacetate hydrolase family protein [Roseomonas sp. OT10]UFN49297.1 fumarylacetoacetate hydrolase family protein [Roseomonas sp. OT10]